MMLVQAECMACNKVTGVCIEESYIEKLHNCMAMYCI